MTTKLKFFNIDDVVSTEYGKRHVVGKITHINGSWANILVIMSTFPNMIGDEYTYELRYLTKLNQNNEK